LAKQPRGVRRPGSHASQAELSFRQGSGKLAGTDATEQIVEAFDKNGPQAAWDVYSAFRQDPKQLKLHNRRDLAILAFEQGLVSFALQILDHVVEDFPDLEQAEQLKRDLLAEFMPKPSAEMQRKKNGLLYVELAIRNNTGKIVQTYVRGPTKHPFSYGIPIPIGKVRVEKWPVGTRLYETQDGVRKELLLIVSQESAGEIISLNRKDEDK
jgi:hypothetical protein